MLMCAGGWMAAHEGHGIATVKPVYREVQAGDARFRLGFAMQPQDALVGEDIRLEFHILPVSSPPSGTAARHGQLEVQVIAASGAPITPHVSPGEKPGTFLVRHRFDTAGQYRVTTRLDAGADTAGTEFPILVSSGPVLKTAMVVDAIVVLVVGALLLGRMRRSQPTAPAAGWGGSAALAGVGVAALVASHMWLAPSIGRMFLPERHTGSVPWQAPPQATGAAVVEGHEHPSATPPHTHDAQPAKAPETPPHSRPPGTPHSHGRESPPPSGQRP